MSLDILLAEARVRPYTTDDGFHSPSTTQIKSQTQLYLERTSELMSSLFNARQWAELRSMKKFSSALVAETNDHIPSSSGSEQFLSTREAMLTTNPDYHQENISSMSHVDEKAGKATIWLNVKAYGFPYAGFSSIERETIVIYSWILAKGEWKVWRLRTIRLPWSSASQAGLQISGEHKKDHVRNDHT